MSGKDYHDYVIKDGHFIGDFENMYRDCEDPWRQSQQPNPFSRSACILYIKRFDIKSILECGCGLGYYADHIYRETGIVPKSVDLSETGIKRARELFPHLDFEVANITNALPNYSDLDAVLFAEIIWYILPELQDIFKTLRSHYAGKFLLVNQVFYKGTQQYGTECFTNLQEFIEFVPFELLAKSESTLEPDLTIETSTVFRIP